MVDVFFDENPQTVVRGISLASGIDPTTLQAGMKVGVHTYNETSPQNMVVSYVIGQILPQPNILIRAPVPANSGSAGTLGQVSWDATHFYIAIGNNSWVRATLSSF